MSDTLRSGPARHIEYVCSRRPLMRALLRCHVRGVGYERLRGTVALDCGRGWNSLMGPCLYSAELSWPLAASLKTNGTCLGAPLAYMREALRRLGASRLADPNL
jgi:hypothetical protein